MIEDWMATLADKLSQVEGIQAVYTYEDMPGALIEFPALVILPKRGSQSYGASAPGVALHDVQMTLYVAGQFLPEAQGAAVPFIARIRRQLAKNVTMAGTMAYILPPEEPNPFYEGPGGIRYGDATLTGIIFNVRVKEVETIVVEA